jgi:hypothetical protein
MLHARADDQKCAHPAEASNRPMKPLAENIKNYFPNIDYFSNALIFFDFLFFAGL